VPDTDHAIPWLAHRSALTHSVLPALVAFGFGRAALGAGMGAGIAIALVDDLFPRAWHGAALIHLPWGGTIGWWSIPWIALNALAGLMIALRAGLPAGSAFWGEPRVLATLTLALAYLLGHQANPWALAVLAVMAWVAWRVRGR
jgi:hypothetical protein